MFAVLNVNLELNFFIKINSILIKILNFIENKSFPAELPIFVREHQNGMYMVLPYYLSKTFTDVNKL